MTATTPEWVTDQLAVREAEAMQRTAYDDWAAHYAYMGSSDPAAVCPCSTCQAAS
jgi:hypothetical protein